MTSILETYWNEFDGGLSRLPVWLPGSNMELGDVGTLETRGWNKLTTLESLGIPVRSDTPGGSSQYDYASHGGVDITAGTGKTGVELQNIAVNAELVFKFHRTGAFVFKAAGVMVHRIADLAGVDAELLNLYGQGRWRPEWTVVTEVARGAPALVLVAAESGAEIAVTVRAQWQVDPLVTAGAMPAFTLGSGRGLAGQFVTDDTATLMWRGHYVRDPLWRKARMRERGKEREPSQKDLEAARVENAEYLSDILYDSPPEGPVAFRVP
ncbi:hypothetical protein [Streptomyces sp. NBC_00827]|uniref:hypothetical protein n=1 Tax=Streptomyces sp. NBC_00827 TaxID=2903677 RepID=UPI00386A363B|nr:hypothetical protein OG569_16330 [Streptomyces sp. NBC_00827]